MQNFLFPRRQILSLDQYEIPLWNVLITLNRCVLNVKSTTSNVIVVGECDQMPPSIYCHMTRWPHSAGASQHELHVIFSNPTIPCGAMALEFTIHWDGLIFNMLYEQKSPELLYLWNIWCFIFLDLESMSSLMQNHCLFYNCWANANQKWPASLK